MIKEVKVGLNPDKVINPLDLGSLYIGVARLGRDHPFGGVTFSNVEFDKTIIFVDNSFVELTMEQEGFYVVFTSKDDIVYTVNSLHWENKICVRMNSLASNKKFSKEELENLDCKDRYLGSREPDYSAFKFQENAFNEGCGSDPLTQNKLVYTLEEKINMTDTPGYHLKEIEKGVLGESSKIREELEELIDAEEQSSTIMVAIELSDLYGALKHYAKNQGLSMDDLRVMSEITERAFANGHR